MICECGTEMEFIGTNWICPKCSGKITNAREELIKLIREDKFTCSKLADAILDKLPELGFIRLEDVSMDKVELAHTIMANSYHDTNEADNLAYAISQAKGIIKRKEGK